MRPDSTLHVCAFALGCLAISVAQAGVGQTPAQLVVRVGNYAGVPSATLARAQETLSRIFRTAGVEVRMVDRTGPEGESEPATPPLSLNLSIVDGAMAAQVPCPRAVMGFVVPSSAFVCFDHVKAVVPEHLSLAVVLGHVMAHELGHLLLGEGHHSTQGLMTGTLGLLHLALACRGGLLFEKQDAERIRGRLQERTQANGQRAAVQGETAGSRYLRRPVTVTAPL